MLLRFEFFPHWVMSTFSFFSFSLNVCPNGVFSLRQSWEIAILCTDD